MDVPVFITGTGLITVQGLDVESNWTSLVAGRVLHDTGIVPLARDITLPRVSQLAIHATREALAAVGHPALNDHRIALVVGTSKGPIEDWIDQLNGVRPPDVALGVSRVAADVATAVGQTRGPRLTLSGACASGLHALIRAGDLIRQGTCDNALVVAAEASTHALFQANFRRLGVLANPLDGCRPYDVRRRGFLLAEGAAAVWLSRTPARGAIQIGHGLSLSDATHLTAPDPVGYALEYLMSKLDSPKIDLVHGHGTGTLQHDAVEFAAVEAIYGHHGPTLYSHKHAIGHTQGAAGLIGTVLNVEMHRRSTALANSNTSNIGPSGGGALMDRHRIQLERAVQPMSVNQSIVIAAGFGSTLAGVRLCRLQSSSGLHELLTPQRTRT